MINFKTEVLSLYTVKSENGLNDVIKRCTWREVAEKDGAIAQHHQNTEFISPDPSVYTKYDTLTESTIVQWIYQMVDIYPIRERLGEEVLGMLDSSYVFESMLPWAQKEYDRNTLYVLVHNEDIVYGPVHWHSSNFNFELSKLGIQVTLPEDSIAYREVCPGSIPYVVDENTKIYKASMTNSRYDEADKFIKPNNIVWDLSSGVAIGTYTPVPQDLNTAKEYVKNEVTFNKEKAEIDGLDIEFHDGNIADMFSGPAARQVLMMKYLSMTDDPLEETHIKCRDNTWLHLSKEDTLHALRSLSAYHESIVKWEEDKYQEIEACFTIDQLKNIDTVFVKMSRNID